MTLPVVAARLFIFSHFFRFSSEAVGNESPSTESDKERIPEIKRTLLCSFISIEREFIYRAQCAMCT